ncbi:MAG: DUF3791 domain-containing protein [Fibromonadaceae bacterium]|jgi:hypothetical protein|nr:DUF3791 domain-containing protein [Fibromonadaceae bacterium]
MNDLSEESRYFLYLIEQYALHKGINGKQALDLFEKQNLVEYIYTVCIIHITQSVWRMLLRILMGDFPPEI